MTTLLNGLDAPRRHLRPGDHVRGRRDAPSHDRGAPQLTRILFVCLGNICRSPTAEGVMRALVREQGARGRVEVDSAGTGLARRRPGGRAGHGAAARRGDRTGGRRRQIRRADFAALDLLLAMDGENRRDLRAAAPDEPARPRCGCCAPTTRARRELEVPTRTTAAPRARRARAGRRRVPGLLDACASGREGEVPRAGRPPGCGGAGESAAATPRRVRAPLDGGALVFAKTAPARRPARIRGRGRRAGLAGRARRASLCRRVLGDATAAGPGAGRARRPPRDAALGRGWRGCTARGARAAAARRAAPAIGPLDCRTSPRRSGRRSTPSAG